MTAVTSTRGHRVRAAGAVAVLAVSLLLPGCSLVSTSSDGFPVKAEFSRGTGLYPGSPVRVLGINVGRIAKVRNMADHVEVVLTLDHGTKVPADAHATIVPLTLLGERYVQLGPAWTGGPTMKSGTVIPESRTTVPVEIDELLRGLKDFLGSINPKNAADVVTRLSQLLDGQGDSLNELIGNTSDTLSLLADKSDDLRAIIKSLADLSSTLRGRTQSIETLVQNYDLVAGVLIQNRGDLDATVHELDRATTELTGLLQAHENPLKGDVAQVTKVGQTLDQNFDHLDITLASTVKLFQAAGRAYDPERNALTINDQLNPGYSSELIAARLRDRVAGLCRRLGLSYCSDPSSAFLQSLAGLIPGIIDGTGSSGLQSSPVPGGGESKAAATSKAPAARPTPPPTTPAPPSSDQLVTELTKLLTGPLDGHQTSALTALDPTRLQALLDLDPAQLAVLPKLDEQQLAQLRTVDPTQLGEDLDRLAAQVSPPSSMLQPLLPTTPKHKAAAPGGLNGLLDQLLGGGS